MLRITLDSSEDSRQATRIFWSHSCLACLGVIGLISALLRFMAVVSETGNEEPSHTWEDDYEWYAVGGGSFHYPVCSRLPVEGEECPSGWQDWDGGGAPRRCYKLVRKAMRWEQAKVNCEDIEGGSLASIPTETANGAVHEVCGDRQPCWIGAAASLSGAWSWADDTPWSYSNWAEGEGQGGDGQGGMKAVMGKPKEDTSAEDAEMFGNALGGLASALITVAILCCMCWGFQWGALTKNDCCLVSMAICDGVCICLTILGIVTAIMGVAASGGQDPDAIVSVLFQLLSVALFAGICIKTLQLRSNIMQAESARQAAAASPTATMVVGVPVVGTPVMAGQLAQPQVVQATPPQAVQATVVQCYSPSSPQGQTV